MLKNEKNIIIIGASGNGKVVADLALKNNYKIKGFLDDNGSLKEMVDFPVLGKICEAEQYKNTCEFVIAIGSNAIREKIAEQYNMKWATLVHPTATIGIDVDIEDGTVVMANAVINSSTRIGKHCIINTGAIVEHDNILEDYVHIAPNASLAGAVNIGEKTWVGIGASVKNNVSICDNCLIGAGGVVIKSIEACGTYAGVPVRKVK